MAALLQFSEAAALGLHAMGLIAVHPEGRANARELAGSCRASEAHMIKVCQTLARRGLLSARRGIGGGFTLAREPSRIRLIDIYVAIEGPVRLRACLFRQHTCRGHGKHGCVFGKRIRGFEEDLLGYLKQTTLSDIVEECMEGAPS